MKVGTFGRNSAHTLGVHRNDLAVPGIVIIVGVTVAGPA